MAKQKTTKSKVKKNNSTQSNSSHSNKKVSIGTRGRVFKGIVIKKFPGRVVIEFERTVRIQKYERFYKKKSKVHAKLPEGMDVHEGDYVKVQECRPISKIIHAIVTEKISSAEEDSE